MFDREKFKNLMHYVIFRAGDHDGFGATKLYKVLWFSEARRFILSGSPIAGAEYIREKHGPIPKLGMAVREELVEEGKIKQWRAPYHNRTSWRFKSVVPPFPLMLSDAEKQVVDYWVRHIDEDHTAQSISEESHDYAWEIAGMKEPLPFFALLAATHTRPPEGETLEWARRRAKELGLK